MAATPVLERERVQQKPELKAYGKLSGGVESAEMTEEQRALNFNSRISENYQKLINPDFTRAEEIMGESIPQAAPVYDTPEDYARATLYPEREQQVPEFVHHRVEGDIFRADSPINARVQAPAREEYEQTFSAAPEFAQDVQPAYAPSYEEAPAYENYAEENEDLKPTATTIQYRTDLYAEERPAAVSERKRYAMTAKGKLLMAVYAVVVVVVLALIIINTSVIKSLDESVAAREAELNAAVARAEQLASDIEVATSDETVIDWALDHGMYFGD